MIRILILLLFSVPVLAQPNVSQWSDVAPVPEPIPDGKVITVAPNDNVKRIIETASNATVRFLPGTFELGPIFVPVGVNLDLGSSLVVATQPGGFNQVQAVFWFKSSRAEGNQTISGGTIDGRNIAAGGIIIDGRDKVQISGTKFQNFLFLGLWVLNSNNGEAKNLEFLNTSGASSSWAAGEFCFFNISNWDIHHIKVKSTSPSRGYGFKALYGGGFITNVRFANITTEMHHASLWNNGASNNIGIEIHDTLINGDLIIENCHIGNQLSLACIKPNPGKVIIRNNIFDMGNDRYSIEGIVNNLQVYNNTFKNSQQWVFNGKPTIKVQNWSIINNTYDQGTAPNTGWGGVFLFGANGASGINISGNKIRHKSGNELVKFQGVSGGVNDVRASNQITSF